MESRVAKTLQSSGLAQVGHFSAIKGFIEAAPNDAAIALQLSKHAMAYFLWRVVRSMKTLGRRIVDLLGRWVFTRFLALVRQH